MRNSELMPGTDPMGNSEMMPGTDPMGNSEMMPGTDPMGNSEMGTKESFAAFGETIERIRNAHIQLTVSLVLTNKNLRRKYTLSGPPPPAAEDLGKTVERARKQARSGKLGQVKGNKNWQEVPHCLWQSPYMLAHDQTVLNQYLRGFRSQERWTSNHLVVNYLGKFDLKDESFDRVGRELAATASRFDTSWRDRHWQFSIFTPHRGPGRIAVAALDAGSEVHSVLEEAGLIRDDLLYQGLGVEVLRAALEIQATPSRPREKRGQDFDCILNWVLRGDEFKFETLRAEIATKLLIRWAYDYLDEGDEVLSRTCEFLLDHYLDPRQHPDLWDGVEEDAMAVIMRWLAQASMEQFL